MNEILENSFYSAEMFLTDQLSESEVLDLIESGLVDEEILLASIDEIMDEEALEEGINIDKARALHYAKHAGIGAGLAAGGLAAGTAGIKALAGKGVASAVAGKLGSLAAAGAAKGGVLGHLGAAAGKVGGVVTKAGSVLAANPYVAGATLGTALAGGYAAHRLIKHLKAKRLAKKLGKN